ncbi:unnamed protein product [Peronospora belbahrii]|uniref:Peptidase A2 domain-containing protein n=1 Tax=Peronospora belbahrii TaxID=622444 RepID=A0ABN8CPI9_9STRA|nr:unnamed protein product [Peronospora belbahrii]
MLGTGADSSLVAKEVHIAFGNEGRKIEVQTVDKLQLTGIVVNLQYGNGLDAGSPIMSILGYSSDESLYETRTTAPTFKTVALRNYQDKGDQETGWLQFFNPALHDISRAQRITLYMTKLTASQA